MTCRVAGIGVSLGTSVEKAERQIAAFEGAGLDPSSMNSKTSKHCGFAFVLVG